MESEKALGRWWGQDGEAGHLDLKYWRLSAEFGCFS